MAPPASSGIEEEIAVDRDGYDSSNATKTVCVMDASGHFASALVRRLLLRGYTVHAALHNHGINLLLHFFLSLSFFFFFIIFISSIQFLIFFFGNYSNTFSQKKYKQQKMFLELFHFVGARTCPANSFNSAS